MVRRFERFTYAMSEISRCWHKIAGEEMQKYGLSGSHSVYLTTLYQHSEGITAAQLGELCGRDKADVSRMMAVMEKKGLVLREPTGKNVYRSLIKLTEEGKYAAEHVHQRAIVAVTNAGKGISDANRETFYDALETIMTNMQTLSKEGLPQQ